MGASSSNTNEMQGLANKCTGGDMTKLVLKWTTSLDTSSRTLYWNGQLVWTPALGLYF